MARNDDGIIKHLLQIACNPVTANIFTAIFSALIIFFAELPQYSKFPCLITYVSSFLFSIFAVLVLIFDLRNVIARSSFLRKLLAGKNVMWHDIQLTMSIYFACSNVTCFLNGGGKDFLMICSFFNIAFFTFSWYLASKAAYPHLDKSCSLPFSAKYILTFLSLFQTAMLIFAAYLLLQNYLLLERLFIAVHTFIPICISVFLTAIQIDKKLGKEFSCKLIPEHRMPIYLQICLMSFTMTAIFTCSTMNYFAIDIITDIIKPIYNSIPGFDGKYPTIFDDIKKRNLATDIPIPFALLCTTTFLSLLDFWIRANYSNSTLNDETFSPLKNDDDTEKALKNKHALIYWSPSKYPGSGKVE